MTTPTFVELPEGFKLAIATPSGEEVKATFMRSLIDTIFRNKVPLTGFINVNSSRIAFNRNILVEMAQKAKATHILFIDADMTFPTGAILRLISHKKDIVGATAAKRDGDDHAVGWTFDGGSFKSKDELTKMKMLGLPFMLIDMKVFEKMRAPWFAEPPRFMLPECDPADTGLMPEDEYFCRGALEAGYDIWCDVDLSLHIGHQGSKTYYIGEREQTRIIEEQEEKVA